ncbi:MAG: dCTP deaminase [Deltaproteobacteria bacterium]|nr:dCTP deaminase [Deltaproteobacteria bacterium]
MMLSNEDIKKAIENKALIIEPFHKRCIRAAGVTLHLGAKLLKPEAGIVVDVKAKKAPKYKEIVIEDAAPYKLMPGEFLLGHTYESVTVGSSIGFLIEGRSTLARVGLTIVQTAMLVYPGHRDRPITLEFANHGPNAVLLYPKMKIARVVLFELKTPSSERYDDCGKYRNQESVGTPIFEDEFMGED